MTYALSPAIVWAAAILVVIIRWATGGTRGRERLWLLGILLTAVAIRILVVAGLFLSAGAERSIATLFPDEGFILHRALWIRNLALGIPIAWPDHLLVQNPYGESGYLYVLAYAQLLLGPSPYGVRLLNMCLYLAAALVLYRTARAAYGRIPALGGLAAILLMPSLTLWSVSALKEPAYVALMAISVAAAVAAGRAGRWPVRLLAVMVCALAAYASEDIRRGGQLVIGGGILAGAAIAFCLRSRVLLATVAIVALLAGAWVLQSPPAHERIQAVIRQGAAMHIGYVRTPGWNYKLLEPEFYAPSDAIVRHDYQGFASRMTPADMTRFVIRSAASFILVPLPWTAASPSAVAFLPQHLIWYMLFVFAVLGIPAGMRANPLFTGVLVCTMAIGAAAVALSSGNVGTLVRHRDTAIMPLIVWLSSLGFCSFLQRRVRQPSPTRRPPFVTEPSTLRAPEYPVVDHRIVRGSIAVRLVRRITRLLEAPPRVTIASFVRPLDESRAAAVADNSRLLGTIERFFMRVAIAWRSTAADGISGRIRSAVGRLEPAQRLRFLGWVVAIAAITRAMVSGLGSWTGSGPGMGSVVILALALLCIAYPAAVLTGLKSRYHSRLHA